MFVQVLLLSMSPGSSGDGPKLLTAAAGTAAGAAAPAGAAGGSGAALQGLQPGGQRLATGRADIQAEELPPGLGATAEQGGAVGEHDEALLFMCIGVSTQQVIAKAASLRSLQASSPDGARLGLDQSG